ncbi:MULTISPECIES: glycoside hydrolase family 92 protein [unclassified Pedobacter]|nr:MULTISPECIES: glycoside hydrolase family 92 protein [unclassified Pedobacter]
MTPGIVAYDENNGWLYRWDVLQNLGDLVNMIGGKSSSIPLIITGAK